MTLLKPIQQKKISDQVFEQLKDLIHKRKFKPGEQLMPERDMAEYMNVSRSTIRTAINKLVSMRLVEHQQGRGTFVSDPASKKNNPFAAAMSTKNVNIYDLMEVRMGLECTAAANAAKRANPHDIMAIEQSVDEMEKKIRGGRLGSKNDIYFHLGIVYATKNPLHIQIIQFFYDYVSHGIMESFHFKYESQEDSNIILGHHKDIIAAIKNRDPVNAYQSMKYHIDHVRTLC